MDEIKRNYEMHMQRARGQVFGMDFVDTTRTMKDMKNDKEFQRILNMGWESGGFRFIFETFADSMLRRVLFKLFVQRANDHSAHES